MKICFTFQKILPLVILHLLAFIGSGFIHAADKPDKLKVLVIFAHPDEGELYTGGISTIYTKLGHRVKFLSLTNGDAGHWSMNPDSFHVTSVLNLSYAT